MNPLAKIVCAADLGAASPRVLAWAALFSRTLGAEVSVLHAEWWEPPEYFTEGQIEALAAEAATHRTAARARLQALAESALSGNASYGVEVKEGPPARVILDHAEAMQADLIVMGSHGRTGLARLRLGSVAEDVVRESSRPVLIVKGQETSGVRLRRVLLPVKPGVLTGELVAWAASIATAFAARLLVVAVAEDRSTNLATLRAELCNRVPPPVRTACEVEEVARAGNAAEEIVLVARERDVDLIILAAEHSPFLEWTTLGTTTERVMRHSPSSVLVAPWLSRPARGPKSAAIL